MIQIFCMMFCTPLQGIYQNNIDLSTSCPKEAYQLAGWVLYERLLLYQFLQDRLQCLPVVCTLLPCPMSHISQKHVPSKSYDLQTYLWDGWGHEWDEIYLFLFLGVMIMAIYVCCQKFFSQTARPIYSYLVLPLAKMSQFPDVQWLICDYLNPWYTG